MENCAQTSARLVRVISVILRSQHVDVPCTRQVNVVKKVNSIIQPLSYDMKKLGK